MQRIRNHIRTTNVIQLSVFVSWMCTWSNDCSILWSRYVCRILSFLFLEYAQQDDLKYSKLEDDVF